MWSVVAVMAALVGAAASKDCNATVCKVLGTLVTLNLHL